MPLKGPLLAILLAACAGDDASTTPPSGDYQFSTLAVQDACLDGALEAVFMPNGPEQPHPFEFPVFLPAPDATPLTYDVDFRAPFLGMTVTVTADGSTLAIADSVMPAVRLNQDRYGDCDVTITVAAELSPETSDQLAGTATLSLSDLRGNDGRCPPVDADPCTLSLTLRAELLQESDVP